MMKKDLIMTTALYAGSFDPITYGHTDIIEAGLNIFDKVIIGVAVNPDKKTYLPLEKRVELIKICFPGIEVYSYSNLTVKFAKEHGATVLLRGLRSSADFEYENQLAQINSKLDCNIKTVFLTAKPEHSSISSSAVRELLAHKYDLSKFVPNCIIDNLYSSI